MPSQIAYSCNRPVGSGVAQPAPADDPADDPDDRPTGRPLGRNSPAVGLDRSPANADIGGRDGRGLHGPRSSGPRRATVSEAPAAMIPKAGSGAQRGAQARPGRPRRPQWRHSRPGSPRAGVGPPPASPSTVGARPTVSGRPVGPVAPPVGPVAPPEGPVAPPPPAGRPTSVLHPASQRSNPSPTRPAGNLRFHFLRRCVILGPPAPPHDRPRACTAQTRSDRRPPNPILFPEVP